MTEIADIWFRTPERAVHMGARVQGGGVHSSKTMMIADLSALLARDATLSKKQLRTLIIDENVLAKRSQSAREVALDKLGQLYGLDKVPAVAAALVELWPRSNARPMLATMCAIARDPLFRASAEVVMMAQVGEDIASPQIRVLLERQLPNRFKESTMSALAERCASSWAQGGYLSSGTRKRRQRATPDHIAAAYAAFLGLAAGFGGASILTSPWLNLLDVEVEMRLSLLRQAEADNLVRIHSAGHVFDIELRGILALIAQGGDERRGTLI